MNVNEPTTNLNDQLKKLVAEVRSHPPGSAERQVAFAEIVRLVMCSGKLWREKSAYYADAVQEMWEYCFLKIDDADVGYDPSICQLTTWLNDCLKRALRRYRDRDQRQQKRHLSALISDAGMRIDPVDTLVARSDPHTALEMWDTLITWVQADPDRHLRAHTCLKYPHINAQMLLLRRLPPNVQSWDDIADELQAEKKYIAQWYSRYCNSLLRAWGKTQRYFD